MMMMMGSVLLCSKREIIFSRWGGSVRYFERERERERGQYGWLFWAAEVFKKPKKKRLREIN